MDITPRPAADAGGLCMNTVPPAAGATSEHEVMENESSIDDRIVESIARIIIRLKELGASNRSIAKKFGFSEPTFRRMWNASRDADRSEKTNNTDGGNAVTASNDASPPLKAVLRNLPKLTAAEREVVQKELDILLM